MSMGRRENEPQSKFWVAPYELPRSPGHPFYEQLNRFLDATGFDRFCEAACRKFYAQKMGRPSIAPGRVFPHADRGYFEKIDSKKGIAWRCSDSLPLRAFLGLKPEDGAVDDSSMNRARLRIDLETHQAVFDWMLKRLTEYDLLKGKTLGLDGSTTAANAVMRSIVRRESGQSYRAFLEELAKESGIETPTAEDLAEFDRKRKGKKCSNDDWFNPHDPHAKIAKMKDGTTHLAYKPEHAVDMETGAIVVAVIHPGSAGDTTTLLETLEQAGRSLQEVREDEDIEVDTAHIHIKEVVADKGYHSGPILTRLEEVELRGYIAEPDPGRQRCTAKDAKDAEEQMHKRAAQSTVYANPRRRKGERSKSLHRKRGELVSGASSTCWTTAACGGHTCAAARTCRNVTCFTAAFNLGLIMRKLTGFGTPKGWAAALRDFLRCLFGCRRQSRASRRISNRLAASLLRPTSATNEFARAA